MERQRALKAAGVVTQADSERVEFELREAMLRLRKAQRDLDLTRIVAPFAGVVTGRTARLRRLVSAGDTLFRLTALGPVLAAVRVPEATAVGLGIGAEAEVVGPRGDRPGPGRAGDPDDRSRERHPGGRPSADRGPPAPARQQRHGAARLRAAPGDRRSRKRRCGEGYALVWADDRTTLRAGHPRQRAARRPGRSVSGLAPGEKVVRNRP